LTRGRRSVTPLELPPAVSPTHAPLLPRSCQERPSGCTPATVVRQTTHGSTILLVMDSFKKEINKENSKSVYPRGKAAS